jgi:hypothetical protein
MVRKTRVAWGPFSPLVQRSVALSKMNKSDPVTAKSKLALLPSESEEEFANLRAKLFGEIKPEGAIEEIYVGEVAHYVLETLHPRLISVGVIQKH